MKLVGGGAKYPSAVLIVPQPQLYDLGRKAVGLFFRITWGHSSKDQNALAYGGNQLFFHRDRRGEHSLKYGCEWLMRRAGNTKALGSVRTDSPFILSLELQVAGVALPDMPVRCALIVEAGHLRGPQTDVVG